MPSPTPTASRAAPNRAKVGATAQTSMPTENRAAPPSSSRRLPARRMVAAQIAAPSSIPMATREPTVPADALSAPTAGSCSRDGTVTP